MHFTPDRSHWASIGKSKKTIFTVGILLGIVFGVVFVNMLTGVAWVSANDESALQETAVIKKILVLPFCDMSTLVKEGGGIRGPLTGMVFDLDVVDPQALAYINTILYEQLQFVNDITTYWPTSGETSAIGVLPATEQREARIATIQMMGRRERVDAVLCGFLYAFREREGGNISIQKPAKVVFELNLISSTTGRLIWQSKFSETQKSLNEDLLKIGKFLSRKGRWITAKQMAQQAIKDVMTTFPSSSTP